MRLVSLATAPGQQLDADAAASWDRVAREVQRRYGWTPYLTDSVRRLDVQIRIFLERYEQRASGVGPYGDVRWWQGRRYVRVRGAAAAPPGTSRHGLGLAVDCSGLGGFMGTKYLQLMSVQHEHGWSNDVGRSIAEAWHQEYSRAKDRHAGAGGGSAVAPAPFPTPAPVGVPTEQGDDDMLFRIRVAEKTDGVANASGQAIFLCRFGNKTDAVFRVLTRDENEAVDRAGVPIRRIDGRDYSENEKNLMRAAIIGVRDTWGVA